MELYTIDQWSELGEDKQQALLFRSMITSDIQTPAELRTRILEHVHISSLEGSPVRLANLNRRFHQAKRRVYAEDLLDMLMKQFENGAVFKTHRFKGSTLLTSKAFWGDYLKMLDEAAPSDPESRAAFIERNIDDFWLRAQ